MSSYRDMLANGAFNNVVNPEIKKVQERIATYWDEYDFNDNGFELKDDTKAFRMEKSNRARLYRKKIKSLKQNHIESVSSGTVWYTKKMH